MSRTGFTFSCNTHNSSPKISRPQADAHCEDPASYGSQAYLRADAFTLAEVLLTLAIIGIIAALTIPAVITRALHGQYVVSLKKAFNTLKGIEKEAIQKHGDLSTWDWTLDGDKLFTRYFKDSFDTLRDCGNDTDGNCFSDEYDGGHDFKDTLFYRITTSDGISYAYSKYSANPIPGAQGRFWVDVNGPKKPNIVGRDLFSFNVFPSRLGIRPAGSIKHDDPDTRWTSSEVNQDCRMDDNREYCAAKVLAEGVMNY